LVEQKLKIKILVLSILKCFLAQSLLYDLNFEKSLAKTLFVNKVQQYFQTFTFKKIDFTLSDYLKQKK